VSLTPLVPILLAPLGEAARRALGLKPDVCVQVDNGRRSGPGIDLEILLPNGIRLDVGVRPPGTTTSAWREGTHLALTVRGTPREDTQAALRQACLEAVGKLFLRAQRQDGEALAAALWVERDAVLAWRGVDDAFFRRVFHGVLGATANLRLGFGCNQDCGLCWQARTWPDAPAETLLTWVDELAALGVRQLTLTGGEPTLHRALPDVLDRARSHGMRTMLQTNAIQLSKPAVLRRIGPQVDRFFVSLHAPTAALSDTITRAPGTWVRTVAGIEAALGAGLRVGLNCVIDGRNADAVAALGAFVVDRFVRPFPDNPVESMTLSRAQPFHDRALWEAGRLPLDRLRPGVLAASQMLAAAGVVVDVTSGSCGLPACVLDGAPALIYLPAAEHLGDADPGFDNADRAETACGRCALRRRCQGPGPGYAEAFGDRGLRPFETLPQIAEGFPLTL
jgi:pyruvate-formate lyase-activating enzyme